MQAIPLEYYLILSGVLFAIGAIGMLTRRTAIILFMSIELMLNSANLALVAFSQYLGNATGQVFVFFVMAVAAAEAAIGLAIVIALFRKKESIYIDGVSTIKH